MLRSQYLATGDTHKVLFFCLLKSTISTLTSVKKWSKSWIQKSTSKLNVPYLKTSLENNFKSGGYRPATLKIFRFTINPLFRRISIALQRGLFPVYHIRLKKCLQKPWNHCYFLVWNPKFWPFFDSGSIMQKRTMLVLEIL